MVNACHRNHWTNLKSFVAHTVMTIDLAMVSEVLAAGKKTKHISENVNIYDFTNDESKLKENENHFNLPIRIRVAKRMVDTGNMVIIPGWMVCPWM